MNRQSAGKTSIKTELDVYKETGSIKAVAKYFDIPYGTAWSRLKKQGVVSKRKKPVKSNNYDKQFFYNIDSSVKAYFLGFIKADGYVDKKRNRLAIRITQDDKLILQRFCDAINLPQSRINIFSKKKHHVGYSENARPCAEVTITNEEFVKPILNVKEESILKKIPHEFRYDFIRGYFDGDGGVYYHNIKKKKFSMNIMGSPTDSHTLDYIKKEFPEFRVYIDKRSDLPLLQSCKKSLLIEFGNKIYGDCNLYLPRKKIKFDFIRYSYSIDESSTTTRETPKLGEDIV